MHFAIEMLRLLEARVLLATVFFISHDGILYDGCHNSSFRLEINPSRYSVPVSCGERAVVGRHT